MMRKNTLILFAKAPKICRVKTRMWPALSHRECLYLHKRSINHAINQFKDKFDLIFYSTQISYYPIPIKMQQGVNLGMRMFHAMQHELKKSERVVLIGSDCLQIDEYYIDQAFAALNDLNDVVLGAANDGGYTLIGAKNIIPQIFHNMQWSSTNVLEKTLDNINQLGLKAKVLDSLIDVDTIEDLQTLKNINALPSWAERLLKARPSV
ncbi:MAG: TIGR04282 family arsenosugar biosynthesis glycosyltransferase [Pseudomonadota bacterium]